MDISPDKLADVRVKNLELLQAVVTRLANQGASLKNYCVTITTAVCGFAVTSQHPVVAILALIPIVSFAALDAKYLGAERRFRARFDQVRSEDWSVRADFDFGPGAALSSTYWQACWSWSVLGFYAPLAGGVLAVFSILGCIHGRIF